MPATHITPEMREFINSPEGHGRSFLRRAEEWLQTHDDLTPRMAQVVADIMEEAASERPRTGAVRRSTFARSTDLPTVANGTYTVSSDDGTSETYRIHTVRNGSLMGQRIIKRYSAQTMSYTGFATLRTNGTIYVWRRFSTDENAYATYIVLMRKLLTFLLNNRLPSIPGGSIQLLDDEPTRYNLTFEPTCRVCNYNLTLARWQHQEGNLRTICSACIAAITETNNSPAVADSTNMGELIDVMSGSTINGASLPSPQAPRRRRRTPPPTTNVNMSQIDSTWEQ